MTPRNIKVPADEAPLLLPPMSTPSARRLDTIRWNVLKHKPIAPIEWLCEPLFPKISIGVVVSQPGHGKTTTLIQLAVALATGLPFMGLPVNGPCGVGLLLLEDNESLIHARLQDTVARYGEAFTDEHGRKLDANLRLMIERAFTMEELNDPNLLDLKLAGLSSELGESIMDTEDPPGLLVIDTLNAVHDGDESSATETRPLIAALRRLHLSLGVSVYLTHHYRKMGIGKGAPGLADRMDPELIRGSSAIHAGVRAVIQFATVTKKDADNAGIKDWEDAQQYAVVALTKINGGRKSKWVLWKHTDGGLLAPVKDGDSLIDAMLGSTAAPKKALTQQDRVLMEIHTQGDHPLDRYAAAKDLGYSPDILRAILSRLRKVNLITKKDTLTTLGRREAETLLGSSTSGRKY